MNLTKEEGRPFYFRHQDGTECAYSENKNTYDKHVSNLEDNTKKEIGLTIFREILEGELRPYNVEIERGFRYKKKLSFIPDIIIKFPNSDEQWAIDYFTAGNQNLTSDSYARHLANRMKTYNDEGFKCFSFVDISWLSCREETKIGNLLHAEMNITSKNEENREWDAFLKQRLQGDLLEFFLKTTKADMETFDSKSIAYVDIANRLCTIFRFIPTSYQDRNMTFYRLTSIDIPLSRALTLNSKQNHFLLSRENEEEQRVAFMKDLIQRKQKVEQEQVQREQRRMDQERERARNANRVYPRYGKNTKVFEGITVNTVVKSDNEILREMSERARKAAERPVEYSEAEWEFVKKNEKGHLTLLKQNTSKLKNQLKEQIEPNKKERILEILVSKPVSGDLYINGDQEIWRRLVLKWIKENQVENSINVQLPKLIEYMKNAGITFNQNDKIVKFPIKEFLEFYQKTLLTELKKKTQLRIKE